MDTPPTWSFCFKNRKLNNLKIANNPLAQHQESQIQLRESDIWHPPFNLFPGVKCAAEELLYSDVSQTPNPSPPPLLPTLLTQQTSTCMITWSRAHAIGRLSSEVFRLTAWRKWSTLPIWLLSHEKLALFTWLIPDYWWPLSRFL